jgi:hypothetical protein
MRTNRTEFPDFMKRASLKKGETVAAFHNKHMIMKWKNKRDVVQGGAETIRRLIT